MDHSKPLFNRTNPKHTYQPGPFTPNTGEFNASIADLPSTHIEVINAEFGISVEMALDEANMEGTLRGDIKERIYSTANRIWTSHRAGTQAEIKALQGLLTKRIETIIGEHVVTLDPRNSSLHGEMEDFLRETATDPGPSPS